MSLNDILSTYYQNNDPLSSQELTSLREISPNLTRFIDNQIVDKYYQIKIVNITDLSIIKDIVENDPAVIANNESIFVFMDSFMNNYKVRLDSLSPEMIRNASVYSLVFEYNEIGENEAEMVADNIPPFLNTLIIGNSGMYDDELKLLAQKLPPSLRHINLYADGITDEGLIALFRSLPTELISLVISYPLMTDKSIKVLSERSFPDLIKLDISYNQAENVILTRFLRVEDSVTDLGLSFNSLGSGSILFLELPSRLKRLDLSGNEIGDEEVEILAPKLPSSLVNLNLYINEIGPDGIEVLAPKLPKTLKTLNLGGNYLEWEGIAALAPYLPNTLNNLNLLGIGIDKAGVEILAPNLPRELKSLNLSNNKIADEGVMFLTKALITKKIFLTELILKFCDIKDPGMGALILTSQIITSLTSIILWGNKIKNKYEVNLIEPKNLEIYF